MICDLRLQCQDENTNLAPYAVKNSESQGRVYPEAQHPFRTDFQRDRDRVLHSKAFRRLEHKTQVFLSGSGDHLRSRLTHTIEVAAISRTMARSLYLNEDLAETISLAHDLGHTPFGHAGERALNKIMASHGGFDHNLQALRIVDYLEVKYPAYDGINLTWEVRAGLVKHREAGITQLDGKFLPPFQSLEAQIADLADDLTYYGHDLDDGFDSGLINADMLKGMAVWERAVERVKETGLADEKAERFESYAIRCLIDNMVRDAICYSDKLLTEYAPATSSAVRELDRKLISFSPEYEKETLELRDFLYKNLYFHPKLERLNGMSLSRMSALFEAYTRNPEEMGSSAIKRIEKDGLCRAAADYIAGMTDVFAQKEFTRICGLLI